MNASTALETAPAGPPTTQITLIVNGNAQRLDLDPRTSLLDALRENLHLTVGELGNCGANASVANAVFNATGVRVRELPITLEKVLAGLPVEATT